MIVGREIPVARDIWLIPPRPSVSARSATNSRACRSFKVLSTFSHALGLATARVAEALVPTKQMLARSALTVKIIV